MSSKTYPLFIHNLDQCLCVVVGGGQVATRKVQGLVDSDVKPKVISPKLSEVLEELRQSGQIEHVAREYQWGDLQGAFLGFACSDDSEVNGLVEDEGKARAVLINNTEDATHSDFSTPAIIRQGSLLLTVSTEGKSPSLTRHIKETLEQRYNERYALLTDLLEEARGEIKALSPEKRQYLLTELTSESYLNQLIIDKEKAKKELQTLLSN